MTTSAVAAVAAISPRAFHALSLRSSRQRRATPQRRRAGSWSEARRNRNGGERNPCRETGNDIDRTQHHVRRIGHERGNGMQR